MNLSDSLIFSWIFGLIFKSLDKLGMSKNGKIVEIF